MKVRPYELMHIVSKIGEGYEEDLKSSRLNEILRLIRKYPYHPITLVCDTTSTYSYKLSQRKGNTTQKKDLFKVFRDLKILQMLGLVPNDTRPALELFNRLFENIKTDEDILYFKNVTSDIWKGEQKKNYYIKGIKKGVEKIIPNKRSKKMRKDVKGKSICELANAKILKIRPHHLMCMACYYNDSNISLPLDDDNIFEIIEIIQNTPDIPIELIEGPCMVCSPCHAYYPEINKCVADIGISLRDELKDLIVLQKLGLAYGEIKPAKELFQLLFSRIKSTPEVCGFGLKEFHAREWRPCGGINGKKSYVKSQKSGMGIV